MIDLDRIFDQELNRDDILTNEQLKKISNEASAETIGKRSTRLGKLLVSDMQCYSELIRINQHLEFIDSKLPPSGQDSNSNDSAASVNSENQGRPVSNDYECSPSSITIYPTVLCSDLQPGQVEQKEELLSSCLLYTSDAADD